MKILGDYQMGTNYKAYTNLLDFSRDKIRSLKTRLQQNVRGIKTKCIIVRTAVGFVRHRSPSNPRSGQWFNPSSKFPFRWVNSMPVIPAEPARSQ